MTPKANLVCKECGYTARRELLNEVACRGHHETQTVPALCPKGHGYLVREDGFKQFTGRDPVVLLTKSR